VRSDLEAIDLALIRQRALEERLRLNEQRARPQAVS
jgi:hypothetical protein